MRQSSLLFLLFLVLFVPLRGENGASMPDPSKLTSGWWKFFQDKEGISQEKINQFLARLNQLKEQTDKERNPMIIVLIDRINLSFKQLDKVMQAPFEYKHTYPLHLSTYTMTDWIEVLNHVRQLKQDRSFYQVELDRNQAKMDLERNELDYYQVQYPLYNKIDPKRVETGLRMINTRIGIQQLEIERNLIKKRLVLINQDLEKLIQEKEFAADHLNLKTLNPNKIEQSLEKARRLSVLSSEKLLEAERDYFEGTVPITEVLEKTVLRQLALAHINYEKILLLYAQLNHSGPDLDVQQMVGNVSSSLSRIQGHLSQMEDVVEAEDHDVIEELAQGYKEKEGTLDDLKDVYLNMDRLRAMTDDLSILLNRIEMELIKRESSFFTGFKLLWSDIKEIFKNFHKKLSTPLFRVNDYPISIWIILRAVITIIVTFFIAKITSSLITSRKIFTKHMGSADLYILASLFYYMIIVIGILAALFSIGLDMTNFAIIAGGLGVGIGFGLQNIANNFVSGMLMLVSKILKVGDLVELEQGTTGTVRGINMQNTQLRTFDGVDIVVPNAELMNKRIVNWTMQDSYQRLHIPFGVSYSSDLKKVEELVLKAAEEIPYTITNELICPRPVVWMKEFGDSSINLELNVWVDLKKQTSRFNMKSHYLKKLDEVLRENGIQIPFPQRDLHIIDMPKGEES